MFENAVTAQNNQNILRRRRPRRAFMQIYSIDTISDAIAVVQMLQGNATPDTQTGGARTGREPPPLSAQQVISNGAHPCRISGESHGHRHREIHRRVHSLHLRGNAHKAEDIYIGFLRRRLRHQ